MKKKELKKLAQQIAKLTAEHEQSSGSRKKELEEEIYGLTMKIQFDGEQDIFLLDEMVQDILDKKI